MGNDQPNLCRLDRVAITAATFGLAVSLAMPLGPAAAGVPNDTSASTNSRQALPSESAKTGGMIVVADKNKNKNWHNDKYYYNKNWNNKKVVVVRPYRKWYKQPYYGTVIGGIALGTILGAAAYSAVAPAPNLCWYWADPMRTQGYWDYCY